MSEQLRAERDRLVAWSTWSSWMARAVQVVTAVIAARWALDYFGEARFGLWRVGSSLVTYLALLNLGVGSSLVVALATDRGAGDLRAIQSRCASASLPFVVLAPLAALGLSLAAMHGPIRWLLGPATSILESEARPFLATLSWSVAAMLVFQVLRAMQQSFQEDYRANLWDAVAAIFGLAGLWAVVASRGGLVHWALVVLIVQFVTGAFNAAAFMRAHPECRPAPAAFSWAAGRGLMRDGLAFFALQISTMLILQTDDIVISNALGPAAVVPYSVVAQIMLTITVVIHAVSASAWSAYAEARARGDWEWIASTYRSRTEAACYLAALAGVMIALWARDVVALWLGPAVEPPPEVCVLLGLYAPVNIWNASIGILLSGLGHVRTLLAFSAIEAIVNLSLSVWCVRWIGIAGVALGTLTPALGLSAWIFPRLLLRATEGRVVAPAGRVLSRAVIPALVAAVCGGFAREGLSGTGGLWRLGIGVPVTGMSFGLAFAAIHRLGR